MSEIVEASTYTVAQDEERKESQAWKVVGSPARRASVTTLVDEKKTLPMYKKPSENLTPPPGFKEDWQPQPFMVSKFDNSKASEAKDMFQSRSTLNTTPEISILTQEEYNDMPKSRSRSKSSSAIFGLPEEDQLGSMPDMASIWSHQAQQPAHRRASTQPSQQTLMWEALRAAQLATPNDLNGQNTDALMDRFKQEQFRRASVAPSMVNRFMTRTEQPQDVLQVPGEFDGRRRHSMAGPVFDRKLNTKFLSEGFEALGLDDANRTLEKIDDYFENTSSRTRAFQEAGKNLQANQEMLSPMLKSPELPPLTHTWPMYVVEFKAGRTDYFYLPEESKNLKISVGDLAIVEADRGKDLGKVIECNINSMAELQLYQATHEDPLVDSHNAVGKEIHPKRIFRLAAPNEVAMLIQKGQDEAKANGLCQIKIRQKKLPMEIVDAEYQWDRRKLTFYFVADRRIDFRELVRELFKIYKTRIWMCAVQPREMLDE